MFHSIHADAGQEMFVVAGTPPLHLNRGDNLTLIPIAGSAAELVHTVIETGLPCSALFVATRSQDSSRECGRLRETYKEEDTASIFEGVDS